MITFCQAMIALCQAMITLCQAMITLCQAMIVLCQAMITSEAGCSTHTAIEVATPYSERDTCGINSCR